MVANLGLLRDLPVYAGVIIRRYSREVEELFILVYNKPRVSNDRVLSPASYQALDVSEDIVGDGHGLGDDAVGDPGSGDILEVQDGSRVAALYFKLFSFVPCWGNVTQPFRVY